MRISLRPKFARTLRVEPLETRMLLAASPWQNPVRRLDVNNNGSIAPSDALVIINRLISTGAGELPPLVPPQVPSAYYDTNGDHSLTPIDLLQVINRLQAPPQVKIAPLPNFSIDVTPQLVVSATSTATIPNGTLVQIDVDLNDNGLFSDPGETNYGQSTLFNGGATFDLLPALPRTDVTGPYRVQVRARVLDSDSIEGTSAVQSMLIDTDVSTVLQTYVDTPDPSYSFELRQTLNDPAGQYKVYDVRMTSQTWRTTADVNRPLWQHWVRIVVPNEIQSNTAVLLIDGGSDNPSLPSLDDDIKLLASGAVAMKTIAIDLKNVPNEPLTFTGDNPSRTRSEDAIIAYSFDQFMDHLGDPGNETWPVLLAMTKSAVRAMDTVQTIVPTLLPGRQVDDFLVTGYSKRGWTTWLTAAVDDRVKAIIPGVFDNLNQGPQMMHHFGAYGFFSQAIQDYNDLQIFDRIMTPEGRELSKIDDPYRYLNNGRFDDMPKLLINSAGDEFFVSDSAQYYFHDLPGTQNYLRYIPNVGHGLDDVNPILSTQSFYDAVVNNRELPQFSWTVEPDGSIRVDTETTPSQVRMWSATNPVSRDFRHAFQPFITWQPTTLTDQGGGVYVGSVITPALGARAFFVELTFPSSIPGNPYVFTTEIHVSTRLPMFAWPFPIGPIDPLVSPAAVSTQPETLAAVASGLAVQQFGASQQVFAASATSTVTNAAPLVTYAASTSPSDDEAEDLAFDPSTDMLDAGAVDSLWADADDVTEDDLILAI